MRHACLYSFALCAQLKDTFELEWFCTARIISMRSQ